jgi:signal transduction histidine kinase
MTFQIYDENDKLVYDGLGSQSYRAKTDRYGFYYPAEGMIVDDDETITTADSPVRYKMVGYVLNDIDQIHQLSSKLSLISFWYIYRYELIVTMVAAILLSIVLFVYLMAAAGHRRNSDEISARWPDRQPFDLFTFIILCIVGGLIAILDWASYGDFTILKIIAYCLVTVVGSAVVLWWCMSLAVRLKRHETWHSCLCYRALAWCAKVIKRLFAFAKTTFAGLKLMPKAALTIGAVLFIEFVYLCAFLHNGDMLVFGWFVERAVLTAATVYVLLCMRRLLIAGKEISGGNMDYHVDTAKMPQPMKEHGEQLNSITEGLNKAVNERMKSERFRTELITNVSHDIKTPLTSIINYVDLLEKEKIPGEKAKEYIAVLSRQSAKLKKLIEDLMEASKASTGSLAVNLERCELNVLLDQCAGEYAEKLKAADLELLVKKPDDPVTVMADGRHMWRIFDNLLGNICKYAMPGTRVYLNLERQSTQAVVTFRNISASRLNLGEDELLERFVRGDSSRNTEGSGLGLSIANSLVQLQNGTMNLTVDGDLFKVTLKFNTVE